MKKFFFVAAIAVSAVACNNSASTEAKADTTVKTTTTDTTAKMSTDTTGGKMTTDTTVVKKDTTTKK